MILVVNAGSSSVKAALFDPALAEVARAQASEVGGAARLKVGGDERAVEAPDHAAAVGLILDALRDAGRPPEALAAAAHRVVHGGALAEPVVIDAASLAAIEAAVPLAPLHNPANLAGIRALAALAPGLPQTASFDTAFHATQDAVASTYAVPQAWRDRGVRRYGFHGLSYAALVARLRPLPRRLLAFHLGNGASACAILDGRSVASTMGWSPLDGLVMGTRAGAVDAGAVLAMARLDGIGAAEDALNRRSGLRALAGESDMRALLARDDDAARFAVEHFCHWAARQGASLIPAMGGLDALAFTGGIGENAPAVRERIAALLAWAGDVPVHVVPAQEERRIAEDALRLLASHPA